ncbi:hypothetical protein LC048_19680 [Mesobacillus subterraneus]|uniref:hypothetical protein n=1 Tax=Mesobacillus subterraneus TaxID=285983 RepID=UPI001CFE4352|nr:hypothetical protein [Mesobacillus subterraneus]WLR54617.1 hypothetical protein LC048_19680 [Mesobacillus subterraneus]
MDYIIQPFLFTTYFFATLLKDIQQRKTTFVTYIKTILFHLLYIMIISIPVGGLMCLYIVMFKQGQIALSFSLFLNLNIFIWGCMLPIVLLNIGNPKLNIPNFIINIYLVIIKINLLKQVMLAIAWAISAPLLYFYLFSNIIFELFPEENWLLVGTLVLCFFFSVMLFTEGTVEHKQRIVRKFMLWFLLFLLLAGFSFSQIVMNVKDGNEIEMIFVVPVVLGLIFNFSFILENARELYKVYVIENKDFLIEKQEWMDKKESYSYLYLKNTLYLKREELKIIKEKYIQMNRREKKQFHKFIIKLFLIMVLFYGIGQFLFVDQIEKIELFMTDIFKEIYSLYVSMFQGDERVAIIIAVLTCFLYYFYKELKIGLSSFNLYSLQEKINQIEKIVFLLTAIVVIVFYLFNSNSNNLWLEYMVIILMVILVIIIPLTRIIVNKINTINSKNDNNSLDQ